MVKAMRQIKYFHSLIYFTSLRNRKFWFISLEAMAAKVPVISSNTGGIPEVNINNFSGRLSDVGDIEKMTNDAIEILSDKNFMRRLK